MNKKEFSLLASALRTYYPREKLLPNEQAMQLWYLQLQDIPYQVAENVVNKWVATEKWPPTIADIRSGANELMNGELQDWGKGWETVMYAIRRYGMYQEERALESMDELTRDTVNRLGYQQICCSTNIQNDRANFRMIYEKLAERKSGENRMPERLRELIQKSRREIAQYGKSDSSHLGGNDNVLIDTTN